MRITLLVSLFLMLQTAAFAKGVLTETFQFELTDENENKWNQAKQHLTNPNDFIKAKLRVGEEVFKVKIRPFPLQGHLQDIIVKLKKEDFLLRSNRFYLKSLEEDKALGQWFYHFALKEAGLLSPKTHIASVVIDGKNDGLFLFIESPGKIFVESNGHREGPVLKYQSTSPLSREVVLAETLKRESDSSKKYPLFQKAESLLLNFFNGELPAQDVFDLQQVASFLAVGQLTRVDKLEIDYIGFYYNPISSSFHVIPTTFFKNRRAESNLTKEFKQLLFKEETFVVIYRKTLKKYLESNALPTWFENAKVALRGSDESSYKFLNIFEALAPNYIEDAIKVTENLRT